MLIKLYIKLLARAILQNFYSNIIYSVFYGTFFTTQMYIVYILKTCPDYPLIIVRSSRKHSSHPVDRTKSVDLLRRKSGSSQRLARRDENFEMFSRVSSQKRLRRTVHVTTDSISLSLSLFLSPSPLSFCFPRSSPWKSARRIKEPRKRIDRLARPRVHYSNRRGGDRWRWSRSRVLYTPRRPRYVCPQIEFPRVFIY